MRVLITGAAGQLGTDLVRTSTLAGDDVTAVDRSSLDVGDRSAVRALVVGGGFDVVFNAAAWTAVDACEGDPDRARRVNALAGRWLGEACAESGSHLVHVSTDYVFDGTLDRPYTEWDATNPQSVYGSSKLAGELEVTGSLCRSTVVRTSWVCGVHGANMVKTVLGLRDRDDLAFVDDQRGCPTFTDDLARMLRNLAAEGITGTIHVTNQGAVSWFEFVRDILEAAGADPGRVRAISTAELRPARPAPRPANSVLDNAVLRLSGLDLLPHYRESLQRTVLALLA